MGDFTSKWLTFGAETGRSATDKTDKTPNLIGAPRPRPNGRPGCQRMLVELRRGQRWLTTQHARWCNGDPYAADDATFSRVLAEWLDTENVLRTMFDYSGCINTGEACSEAEVVSCDACASDVGPPSQQEAGTGRSDAKLPDPVQGVD